MIIRGKIFIDMGMLQAVPETQMENVIRNKLLDEMRSEILKKMEIEEEENHTQNSMEYLGEVVALTKEEYTELKTIEKEYYRLVTKELG